MLDSFFSTSITDLSIILSLLTFFDTLFCSFSIFLFCFSSFSFSFFFSELFGIVVWLICKISLDSVFEIDTGLIIGWIGLRICCWFGNENELLLFLPLFDFSSIVDSSGLKYDTECGCKSVFNIERLLDIICFIVKSEIIVEKVCK